MTEIFSAPIEQDFPYTSRIILRTEWLTPERLCVNQIVAGRYHRLRAEHEHRDWFWRCCRDHHVL